MINFEAIEHETTVDTGMIAEVAGGLAVESFADNPLSPREAEILDWASRGLSNREIGDQLLIDDETVKSHLKKAYPKIKAENRPHAVNILIRKGSMPIEVKSDGSRLTPRLELVMSLVGEGMNNDEIAAQLGRSKETIKTQIRMALAVLGAGNRAHAVRRMYETGKWELPEAS